MDGARCRRTGCWSAGDGVDLPAPAPLRASALGPGEGLRALDVTGRTAAGVAFRPSRRARAARRARACPGAHNAGNACAAALVLEGSACRWPTAFAALATLRAAPAGASSCVGERDGFRVVDDYAHHPGRARGHARRRARPARPARASSSYFQPHMPWRTRAVRRASSPTALAAADVVVLCETYVARGAPDPGVDGAR